MNDATLNRVYRTSRINGTGTRDLNKSITPKSRTREVDQSIIHGIVEIDGLID